MGSPSEVHSLIGFLSFFGVALGMIGLYLAMIAGGRARATDAAMVPVPQTRTDMAPSFAPVVSRAAPAVVNVHSRRVVESRSPIFEDPLFRRFFGEGGGGREKVQNALGSGVIVRADGIIVTNFHVVAEADELVVALADRREFGAKVLLADERTDLAILKLDTKGKALPVLPFRDSDTAQVGDIVLAIGNPFGVG